MANVYLLFACFHNKFFLKSTQQHLCAEEGIKTALCWACLPWPLGQGHGLKWAINDRTLRRSGSGRLWAGWKRTSLLSSYLLKNVGRQWGRLGQFLLSPCTKHQPPSLGDLLRGKGEKGRRRPALSSLSPNSMAAKITAAAHVALAVEWNSGESRHPVE